MYKYTDVPFLVTSYLISLQCLKNEVSFLAHVQLMVILILCKFTTIPAEFVWMVFMWFLC